MIHLLAACASAGGSASETDESLTAGARVACPLPPGVLGYPVSVSLAAGGSGAARVDASYLNAFANAAAYRWQVPSRRRNQFPGWDRVRRRVLTPEPRWADDWAPDSRHRAHLRVTIHRNGRPGAVVVQQSSGDALFDRSLTTIFDAPMPDSPSFPAWPSGVAGDSIHLDLRLGDEGAPGSGVTRFAAQQRPVRMSPGTAGPVVPSTGPTGSRSAIVKYDVSETGRMITGSFETVETSDAQFADAMRQWLSRAHFVPAESNCRPISMTVVQTFGR